MVSGEVHEVCRLFVNVVKNSSQGFGGSIELQ